MEMSTLYREFMLRCVNIIHRLVNEKQPIAPQHLKVLEFENRINNIGKEPTRHDSIDRRIRELYDELQSPDDAIETKRILNYLGIKEPPYKVLYTSKRTIPAKSYVQVFFVDYNSPEDQYGHSRNGGDGEMFYGNGTSKTRAQFEKELKQIYRKCWWTEIVGISEVSIDPAKTVYTYRGQTITEIL